MYILLCSSANIDSISILWCAFYFLVYTKYQSVIGKSLIKYLSKYLSKYYTVYITPKFGQSVAVSIPTLRRCGPLRQVLIGEILRSRPFLFHRGHRLCGPVFAIHFVKMKGRGTEKEQKRKRKGTERERKRKRKEMKRSVYLWSGVTF